MSAEPQIVNVLGEQVSLGPTGFSSAEKFLVNVSEKYRSPEMSDTDEVVLKKVLRTLFSASSAFLPGKNNPVPPCSDKEKELLMNSLRYRFSLLRNELIAERKSQSDSLRLRQILDHIQRLKEYIDFAESVKECKEVDEDILGEMLGKLTEEELLDLLRQFVFFILQGQNPLKEFRGRDPSPKGFVARLSRNPIPNFEEFLTKYREKKYPVPLTIERVLESTKLDLDAMKKGVDDALGEKIKTIITLIRNVIPPEAPLWENPIWDLETPDIVGIVDELLSFVKGLQDEIKELEGKNEDCLRDIQSLTEAQEILLAEQEGFKNQITLLNTEIQRLSVAPVAAEEKAEIESDAKAQIQRLETQIESLQEQMRELGNQIEEKNRTIRTQAQQLSEKETQLGSLRGSQEELERLRQSHTSLQEQLTAAQNRVRECEEVEARVRVLERQVQTKEDELTQLRQNAGELTTQIDGHLREKRRLTESLNSLQEQIGLYNELKEDVEQLSQALSASAENLLSLLDAVQRKREELQKENDPIVAKLLAIKETARSSEGKDPTLAPQVAEILKDVNDELVELNNQKKELEQQIEDQDAQIQAGRERMEEGNRILSQVRAGRSELDGKGFKFETDKDALDAAFKAVEAERTLQEAKTELETTIRTLTAQNQSLQADMEALSARLASELEDVQGQLKEKTDELSAERETVGTLRGDLKARDETVTSLQESLTGEQEKVKRLEDAVAKEKQDAERRITEIQEKSLRDCEEKLNALREEETRKRETLVSAQGDEKGALEQRVAELLRQITTVEGERDAFQAEIAVLKERLEGKDSELAKQKEASDARIVELERQLAAVTEERKEATVTATKLAGQVSSLEGELEELRARIISDTTEKEKVFELISQLSSWIASGDELPQPSIDVTLMKKYGFQRIIESFLTVLPSEAEEKASLNTASIGEKGSLDVASLGMSRCQLIFFFTYVYARHFPKIRDANSSYQSMIMEFLNSVQTDLYKALDTEIPGKLEAVGAGGIPVQLKSKYLVGVLMPLLRQMEMVHESGKKGAEFLKFNLLTEDQLETLHKLHRILLDKLALPKYRDFSKSLNLYVIRKTGNVDDDIQDLYLRFYRETKINREYPVIMYTKPDMPSISKFGFGSEEDFEKFLSSPLEKSNTNPKLTTTTEKSLVTKPIFSFNILYYLFLFLMRDYLSSIEGELDKAGCPLPAILKHR